MPDPDDFHAFQSTSGSSETESGCFTKIVLWLALLLGLLWLIGKLGQ